MNENYRHRQILQLLDERQQLATQEIITLLNISPATARRDLTKLAEQGLLLKVRNGAERLVSTKQPKIVNNAPEKQRIAEAASALCQNGDSVILTCGSTMRMLGNRLCGRKLQIITNYIPLANDLIERNHDDLVIIGGQYHRNKEITLTLNQQSEPQYAANIMFTSGKGFTEEGLFKTDMIIANSEKQMAAQTNKYIVLLDSTKLGKRVGVLFTELDKISLLITGKEADPKIVNILQKRGLKILLV